MGLDTSNKYGDAKKIAIIAITERFLRTQMKVFLKERKCS